MGKKNGQLLVLSCRPCRSSVRYHLQLQNPTHFREYGASDGRNLVPSGVGPGSASRPTGVFQVWQEKSVLIARDLPHYPTSHLQLSSPRFAVFGTFVGRGGCSNARCRALSPRSILLVGFDVSPAFSRPTADEPHHLCVTGTESGQVYGLD